MRSRALLGALIIVASAVTATALLSVTGDLDGESPPAAGPIGDPAGAADDTAAGGDAGDDATGPPYGVGVVTATLIDESRPTPARGEVPAAPSRTLPVTIRYPIDGPPGEEAADAPRAEGAFPLVVFVHGYAAAAEWYGDLLREITSAGFVVAAPDFPLSSAARPGPPIRDPVEQAADVSFVIDALRRGKGIPPGLGRLGRGIPVGVAGQSDGGVTAAGVAYNEQYADPRIGGAAVLTGAQIFFPDPWFTGDSPPFLAVHGNADETNPFGASERLFSNASSPKWLVRVLDGRHLDPFTSDPVRPEISAIVADFFRASLQGKAKAAARMERRIEKAARLELAAHE